ncbi:hypothetical protein JCGZ_27101 [Jatropha curcas]|uniref:RanBP2-type domain-containing protein n=1 Tax=Jatropha curcas TaxID=180498 RepID=A0A067JIZ0_JATCU|nr:hypothetical protein JCGZ_27101 [Jatropha curcas]
MSASKFLLSGNLLFRPNTHKTLFPIPSFFSSKSLHSHRYCSSAVLDTVDSDNTETPNSLSQEHHPWPEWVTFVDRLKTNGYFANIKNDSGTESIYKDVNQLKDPCLSFARDRYDLFKLLSVDDIQKVVESGCPNLLRKAVNSAKRLRAYVRVEEQDVCSTCNLRGSCDRAYVILKNYEEDPRTVDIVRLLMFYALDPLVISGQEKPPGREAVEAAIRKLLSDLIELSQKTPGPPLSKPSAKAVNWKEQERRFGGDNQPPLSDTLSDVKLSQDVEMKRGDWICPKCNFMNFSRNTRCLKCKEEGPNQINAVDSEMKKGDWICSKCDFMNFARNIRCLKCKTEGPKKVDGVNDVEMKKGDWNCPQCEFMNFASKKKCMRCQEPRPKRQLNPGEWECPSCNFLNFSRNASCLKCKCERPNEAKTEYEEQIWRSPY